MAELSPLDLANALLRRSVIGTDMSTFARAVAEFYRGLMDNGVSDVDAYNLTESLLSDFIMGALDVEAHSHDTEGEEA